MAEFEHPHHLLKRMKEARDYIVAFKEGKSVINDMPKLFNMECGICALVVHTTPSA